MERRLRGGELVNVYVAELQQLAVLFGGVSAQKGLDKGKISKYTIANRKPVKP